jgi:hypothetical protein
MRNLIVICPMHFRVTTILAKETQGNDTSEVLLSRKRACVRFASPSMFMVPMKLVLIVLIGLYLHLPQITSHPGNHTAPARKPIT